MVSAFFVEKDSTNYEKTRNLVESLLLPFPSQIQSKQSVTVAVCVDAFNPVDLEARGCIPLRIEFRKLDCLVRYRCKERDVVGLCHRMVHGDVVFVLDDLNAYGVLTIIFFRLQWG